MTGLEDGRSGVLFQFDVVNLERSDEIVNHVLRQDGNSQHVLITRQHKTDIQ